MATADVKVYTGTAISWAPSGGTHALSLSSLTTTATCGWQGAKGDLGTPRGARMAVRLKSGFETSPTAGATIEVYWAASPASTAANENPAGTVGTDGVFATAATAKSNLQFIGCLVAEATTDIQTADVGVFIPDLQYGMPVCVNKSAVSLATATASHALTIYPVIDQIQASA